LATAAAIGAFIISTPGILLDSEAFWRDFKYEAIHTSTGHGLHFAGVSNGFIYHFGNLGVSLSPLVLLIGLFGLMWSCARKDRVMLCLAASFVAYFLLIGRAEVLFLRYTFPLAIGLCAGLGWLAGYAHRQKGLWMIVAGGTIFAAGAAATVAARWTEFMVSPEPRDQVAAYLKAQSVGKEWTVGLVSDPWYYTPPLIPDSAINRGLTNLQNTEMLAAREPRVLRFTPPEPEPRRDWDPRLLDAKPEFIVFSNYEAGDVARLSLQSKADLYPEVKQFEAFMSRLVKEYKEIGPSASAHPVERYAREGSLVHDMSYVRPYLYLWKRKDLP
jgi:hypothetical protein